MGRTSRYLVLVLLMTLSLSLGGRAFAADTSIVISGAESQISGAWETGSITIAFGDNGGHRYVENIAYGQFSSSASIASAFGAKFSNDYLAIGLCAHAVGNTIYFHRAGALTLGLPTITNTSASFTIAPLSWQVMPAIVWATPAAVTYGTALDSAQLNATAWTPTLTGGLTSVPGTLTYTPAAGATPGAGTSTLSVTFVPTDTTNFVSMTQTVSLVVNKATPTITWPTPSNILPGTALSATQLNATANIPGSFVYTPAFGTVLTTGSQTLLTTFTPTDTANYNTTSAQVGLKVSISPNAGIITTLAGSGASGSYSGGYTGDHGAATSATLSMPESVALDPTGNVYFVDYFNNVIRTVAADTGLITTVAGGGPYGALGDNGSATGAGLWSPQAVTTDPSGNLYISDTGNGRIRKVTFNNGAGTITTVAGNGPMDSNVGAGITGLGGPATSALIGSPSGLAVDSSGNVYISTQCLILKVSNSTHNLSVVAGVAYTATAYDGSVTTQGTCGYTGDNGPATSAQISLSGLALDASGNLYLAGNAIRKVAFNSSGVGTITTVAGNGTAGYTGDGGPATSASVSSVNVAVDASGNIFMADASHHVIREVFANTQIIATVAGNGTAGFSGDGGLATVAELDYPFGVAVDANDNFYIGDAKNNRIRAVGGGAKLTPTLTWLPSDPITYGTPLSSTQLSATANIPGTFVYNPPSGSVLNAGSNTISVTFIPTDATDYAPATATVSLTVYQVTPAISWDWPATISYGTALSTAQLNATSTVAGTFSYTPAAGTVLSAGPHVLLVVFTPSDTTNYTTALGVTYLTVAEDTGTWDTGTVTLNVNGSTVATTSYGSTSTPSSIAEALANAASSSLVYVTAVDDDLDIEAISGGAGTNYPYSVSVTNFNHTAFPVPSFSASPMSGNLDGGSSAHPSGSNTQVYSYTVPTGGYDGVGNLLSHTDSVMGTWNFSYDTLNRLANAADTRTNSTHPNSCWQYDAFGNRTLQVQQTSACSTLSASSTLVYGTRNQVTGVIPPGGSAASPSPYTYDEAGNVTRDVVVQNQYLYDGDGRICAVASVNNSGFTVMTGYLYDAGGTRVAKGTISAWSCDPTLNGFSTTNDYILGLSGEQVTEMGVGGATTGSTTSGLVWKHSNVWAAGKLLATYDGGTVNGTVTSPGLHFYFDDPLGTRRVQTDYAGNIENSCSSLPFGDGETCAAIPTEHLFTGKERDQESGNDYFNARYYSSAMGRFMSPDWSAQEDPVPYAKLDDPQTLNLYSYVQNNPLVRTDPTGHEGDGPGVVTPTVPDTVGPSTEGYSEFMSEMEAGAGSARWGLLSGPAYILYKMIHPAPVSAGDMTPEQIKACGDVCKPPATPTADHTKDARPSTKEKHQAGQSRKNKDRGGEKGDERRRPPRKRPDGWKGPWPPPPPPPPPPTPPAPPPAPEPDPKK